ncbi:MAG: hypothetical protein HW421_2027 [Ignavibacteria bacterium]|nr:hypothetical protein [Ignavibacteria bacterium]
MIDNSLIEWLLEGDVAIQYQVWRDLLKEDKPDLKERISEEGWGVKFLSLRKNNEHWGKGFYQPKWISSHYTLLDLKNLSISNDIKEIKSTINKILREERGRDGGINPSRLLSNSDVCINGMFLNYATYFAINENDLKFIVDFLIVNQMPDRGYNCRSNRSGASHSSLHTTLSVIEGILEYRQNGYTYRLNELMKAEAESREFILQHKLFRSHRTGEIIDRKMLMLSYPSRWKYDILRALDYFQFAGVEYDERMQDALDVLIKKRRSDNKWAIQAKHPGQIHFEMEPTGKPSRWNTLRALRVLNHFGLIEE